MMVCFILVFNILRGHITHIKQKKNDNINKNCLIQHYENQPKCGHFISGNLRGVLKELSNVKRFAHKICSLYLPTNLMAIVYINQEDI